MTISRLQIDGMDCAAEEQLVRMKLDEVAGVDRVQVDLDQRRVLVEHPADAASIDAALQTLSLDATHLDDTGDIS